MMWPKVKKSILLRLRLRESWVIFFILGIIMMNYPFISIFDKPIKFSGYPLLYLYLMIGWVISIVVIVLFTKAIDHRDDQEKE
ncbi:hypothetical protein OR1_02909 [Geobacter sp. OR-1]|nr:hypothetical protein OR1_02909 [Geobacter sp. OR-1]